MDEAKRSLRHLLSAKGWEPKASRPSLAGITKAIGRACPPIRRRSSRLMLDGLGDDDPHRPASDTDRDATRAAFVLADHPGIFSRMAGGAGWLAPISSMRAPIPPRTASRPPSSGCGTATATLCRRPPAAPAQDDRAHLGRRDRRREALAGRDKPKSATRPFAFGPISPSITRAATSIP